MQKSTYLILLAAGLISFSSLAQDIKPTSEKALQESVDKHSLSNPEKYLSVFLKPEDRGTIAVWDEEGNLIG